MVAVVEAPLLEGESERVVSQPWNSAPPSSSLAQLSQESRPEALASFFLQDPDPRAGVWVEGPPTSLP